MSFFKTRQAKKDSKELLRQSTHLRNMREDLMREAELKKLIEAEEGVTNALQTGDVAAIEKANEMLITILGKVAPAARPSAFAENFEILVVAVVVAMAFRTFFIQPFKIPTGSMQPTLNGILTEAGDKPGVMDKVPLKFVKWMIYGEWYEEVVIKEDGKMSTRTEPTSDETGVYYFVGNRGYKVPRNIQRLNFMPGDELKKGDILWSGVVTTGDHVFVDKISWNFSRPKRGQVMVFSTDGIKTLPPGTHYIKRLVGLPGEQIKIVPPNILVNGNVVTEPEGIVRIERQDTGYKAGYVLAYSYEERCVLASTNDVIALKPDQYFCLGDNTRNSKDGRYWGSVPAKNTIGPAFMVYWPYSAKRWGLIH